MYNEQILDLKTKIIQRAETYFKPFFTSDHDIQHDIETVIRGLNELDEQASTNENLSTSLKKTLTSFFQNVSSFIVIKNEMQTETEFADTVEKTYKVFLKKLHDDINRLNYVAKINDRNVIIVGGNGVGKSSFVSYLKQASADNIITIPAQKYLYADTDSGNQFLTINLEQVQEELRTDITQLAKVHNNLNQYDQYNRHLFTKLITAIVNEHLKDLNDFHGHTDDLKTKFTRLEAIWAMVFPDMKLNRLSGVRSLTITKGESTYSVNSMSDGEKVVLYYLIQILFAPENSFVVVDEPETFLNPTISNRLWDTLEAEREDINFIYVSHNVGFISSRKDADLISIKNYEYPDNWQLQELEGTTSGLPRELVTGLAGAKKPIIFIEGTTGSYDYTVFTSLFKDLAIVFPVQGHGNVINYTQAYNSSEAFSGGISFGIIDRDLRDDENIEALKEKGVYTLPVNEIEMLYFEEELMKKYFEELNTPIEESTKKINQFKKVFIERVKNKKDRIVEQKAKKILDTFLENHRVEQIRDKTPDDLVNDIIENINSINLKGQIIDFEEELSDVLSNDDYQKLLVMSPLKQEIAMGVSNKLDSKYMEKMSNKFKYNTYYVQHLKEKYFSDLYSAVLESQ